MDDAAWKKRAYDAGLTNARLGEMLGMLPQAVSRLYSDRSKRGLPQYVKALIVAWALLAPDARLQLFAEMGEEAAQSQNVTSDDPAAG